MQPRSWEERLSRPVGRGDQAQVEPSGARRGADARDRGIEQCDDLVDIIGAVPVAVPRPAHEGLACLLGDLQLLLGVWHVRDLVQGQRDLRAQLIEIRLRAGGRVACGPRRFGVALRPRPVHGRGGNAHQLGRRTGTNPEGNREDNTVADSRVFPVADDVIAAGQEDPMQNGFRVLGGRWRGGPDQQYEPGPQKRSSHARESSTMIHAISSVYSASLHRPRQPTRLLSARLGREGSQERPSGCERPSCGKTVQDSWTSCGSGDKEIFFHEKAAGQIATAHVLKVASFVPSLDAPYRIVKIRSSASLRTSAPCLSNTSKKPSTGAST